jgi:hypothetical protein
MAIVEIPYADKVRGKLGNVVIYNSRGQTIMRTRPFNVKKTSTPKQLNNRMKFSVLCKLGKLLRTYINKGFTGIPIKMTVDNSFFKENFNLAFTGAYPDLLIDYSRLIVAKGLLSGAKEGMISAVVGRIINITWTNNSDQKNAESSDIAMALFINQTKNAVLQDTNSRTRADCSLLFAVPETWIGDLVHVYLSFKNATGETSSNSIFLGSMTILA